MSGSDRPDRGDIIARGAVRLAKWSVCFVAIAAGLWVLGLLVVQLWMIVLPVLLTLVVTTVLWPITRWLTKRRVPASAAAALTLLVFLAVFVGIVAAIIPSVSAQAPELADKATAGVVKVRNWLQGPPLKVRDEQLDSAVNAIVDRLQSSGDQIAAGVFTGVSSVTSAVVSGFLILMMMFFFLKDGPRLLPWVRRTLGERVGGHVAEVANRVWENLGGFIRTQALVSFLDAVFIGAGLVILDVPLALALAVVTFIASFIPIVGAVLVGALAVLVALVGNGPTTALIALGIVIAVQQIEGNVLQPILQSRSMKIHAVVVLLAVTAGGSIYGIIGAFLAVPIVSAGVVVMKYVSEQIDAAAARADAAAAAGKDSAADAASSPAPAASPTVPE